VRCIGQKEGNRVRMQRSTAQSIRRKRRRKPDERSTSSCTCLMCVDTQQFERTVDRDNTVSFHNLVMQMILFCGRVTDSEISF
jgi:hypothetical protein